MTTQLIRVQNMLSNYSGLSEPDMARVFNLVDDGKSVKVVLGEPDSGAKIPLCDFSYNDIDEMTFEHLNDICYLIVRAVRMYLTRRV